MCFRWDNAGRRAWVRWWGGFLSYHNPLARTHSSKPCLLLSLRQDSPDVLWESGWAGALGARVGQVPWLSFLPCLGKFPKSCNMYFFFFFSHFAQLIFPVLVVSEHCRGFIEHCSLRARDRRRSFLSCSLCRYGESNQYCWHEKTT